MKKIKLNDSLQQQTSADEYALDPTEKYVIDLEKETEFQIATMIPILEYYQPVFDVCRNNKMNTLNESKFPYNFFRL